MRNQQVLSLLELADPTLSQAAHSVWKEAFGRLLYSWLQTMILLYLSGQKVNSNQQNENHSNRMSTDDLHRRTLYIW